MELPTSPGRSRRPCATASCTPPPITPPPPPAVTWPGRSRSPPPGSASRRSRTDLTSSSPTPGRARKSPLLSCKPRSTWPTAGPRSHPDPNPSPQTRPRREGSQQPPWKHQGEPPPRPNPVIESLQPRAAALSADGGTPFTDPCVSMASTRCGGSHPTMTARSGLHPSPNFL